MLILAEIKKLGLGKTIVLAALPKENYPPANLASMIKQCEVKGREDLGKQIMDQWNKVVGKYPQTRVNWAAAATIGNNSVKKNVFAGAEFVDWFMKQVKLAPEEKKKAKATPTKVKVKAPPLAIPKDDEDAEDWVAEAAKTKVMLEEAETNFIEVEQFVDYLKSTITDLERKIKDYGPKGKKEFTKSGDKHKFAERVPKWEHLLAVYSEKLESMSKIKVKYIKAKKSYEEAPLTTPAYEKAAQGKLENVLALILDMKDLKKQKDLLEKFNKTLEEMDEEKIAASIKVEAGLWDFITGIFNSIVKAWSSLVTWAKNLFNAVDEFEEIATIRY